MSRNSIVALTDYNWYFLLKTHKITAEANFWTPTPWKVKKIKSGDNVYFLLKKKYGRSICGYGKFVRYEEMSLINTWNLYGTKNGVNNLIEMKSRVEGYVKKNSNTKFLEESHIIGNIILKDIVFIDDELQKNPETYGWSVADQVVKFKYINDEIFHIDEKKNNMPFSLVGSDQKEIITINNKVRYGQESFRRLLLKAYSRKCCITGEEEESVLEAAHIQAYISKESNHVQNGLLFRVDFHRLFDQGLITINEDFQICVSKKLNSDYYRKFNGKQISLPKDDYKPSLNAIRWHNKNVFTN